MTEASNIGLEERLQQIAEERERLDQEQQNLRGDAEEELRRIEPLMHEIRDEISEKEKQIEALEQKKNAIEGFLQKLNTRSHPLRRSAVA